jgi:hypothetical protein
MFLTVRIPTCRRWRWLGCGLCGWLALAAAVHGQGTLRRYYIRSANYEAGAYQSLYGKVFAASVDANQRTGIVAELDYPLARLSALAAVLEPEQMQRLLGDDQIQVQVDVPLFPVSGPAGPNWPLNQWTVAEDTDPCLRVAPMVYLVDTGVATNHDDFAYAPNEPILTFLPGMTFGYDYTTLPPVPIPPETDPHDHGTRVAGCLGGRTSGLLGPLGGRANVKSILIYDIDPGFPLAAYASQAIQGILAAVGDHQARRAQPYMKNHASVLVFPHTTTAASGRLADLDQTVEVAWREGLHVVLAAGNEGAAAVEVSPAGAAWGYVDGGGPTRFFFGVKPPAATWFRAADEFLTVGGYRDAGGGTLALSTLTNGNFPTAEAVDVFAPGEAIPCPSAAGPGVFVTGAGTSLAAGFGAAMVAWSAYERPWARPSQVRGEVRAAANHAFGFPKAETPALPESLTYRQWIDHFFPEGGFSLATRDPLADPDGDGVANFVEYHCGQDPRFADAGLRPEILLSPAASGSSVTVRMPTGCHLGSPGLVTWELQTSNDLVTWESLATSTPVPADPPVIEGDGVRLTATAAAPPAPPGSSWFRVRFFATGPLL